MENNTAAQVSQALQAFAKPEKATHAQRFFKTGKGEYAEGDLFLGVTVPEQRIIAKNYSKLSLKEIQLLLKSPYHEERLTALLILVKQFQRSNPQTREEIYMLYIAHTAYINNWDLVDSSAEHIVGPWLEDKNKELLIQLANSPLLWERRIAMLATFHYIKKGNSEWALKVATLLLQDKEDLMHKAVGWMLREIGKRCSVLEEESFLENHFATMHRTTLRYAIERFSPEKRLFWMNRKP